MRTHPRSRPAPLPGLLHTYADRLVAFEYSSTSSTSAGRTKPHTLLFIPGLGDGLGTVAYLNDIVATLEHTEWSVFAPVLTSSYGGWGMSGLGRDIDEIAACVEYIRGYKRDSASQSSFDGDDARKVVIMGHSTGSQDVLQYISAQNPRPAHPVLDHGRREPKLRPQVDGAVMQAPVSDRQAILSLLEDGNENHTAEEMQAIYDAAITRAKRHTFDQHGTLDTVVPLPYTAAIGYPHTTAISSRRFLSLASPDSPQAPGEDDLFSSDLGDERLRKTFGMVHSRGVLRRSSNPSLLVLYSGKDPSVPVYVDKEDLLRRWRRVVDAERAYWHCESGIIPGASHTLEGEKQVEQRRTLIHKLRLFLADVEHAS